MCKRDLRRDVTWIGRGFEWHISLEQRHQARQSACLCDGRLVLLLDRQEAEYEARLLLNLFTAA